MSTPTAEEYAKFDVVDMISLLFGGDSGSRPDINETIEAVEAKIRAAVEAEREACALHFKRFASSMHGKGLDDFGRWIDDECVKIRARSEGT